MTSSLIGRKIGANSSHYSRICKLRCE